VPRADATLVGSGERDALLDAARAIQETGITPAALEVLSPPAAGRESWTLAVRLLGSAPAVEAERQIAAGATGVPLAALEPGEVGPFWRGALAGATRKAVTLRLGALATAMDDALDLLLHHLDEQWVMAGVGAGSLRWAGDAPAERIRLLRHAAAQREMPLTLERAPWPLRDQLGHFGAYREGVGQLVSGLRETLDPAGILVVPLADPR
jgi:hypothetical protein